VNFPIFPTSGVTELEVDAENRGLETALFEKAGARWPKLDPVDERILFQSSSDNCASLQRFIDVQEEAGGYPNYAIGSAPVDSDDDGMPDWFESLYSFDPNTPDSTADHDNDGFTNIEEYINGIIDGFSFPATDDAYVRGGDFELDNYGTQPILITKKSASQQFNREAFLKFDISNCR